MSKAILIDLEHSRQRLSYYQQLKDKTQASVHAAPAKISSKSAAAAAAKLAPVDKWLQIYSERVQKLERQAIKLGLKTQIEALKGQKTASGATLH